MTDLPQAAVLVLVSGGAWLQLMLFSGGGFEFGVV